MGFSFLCTRFRFSLFWIECIRDDNHDLTLNSIKAFLKEVFFLELLSVTQMTDWLTDDYKIGRRNDWPDSLSVATFNLNSEGFEFDPILKISVW